MSKAIDKLLTTAESAKELHEIADAAHALAKKGKAIIAPTVERLGTKHSPAAGVAMVNALGQLGSPEAAPALVGALGHKNARVRAAASRGLEALDEHAVEALEEAAGGKKKALAKRSKMVLGQLPSRLLQLDNALGEVLRAAAALDDDTRASIRKACEEQFKVPAKLPNGRTGFTYSAAPLVEEHGAVAFAVLRDDFLDCIPEWSRAKDKARGGRQDYCIRWFTLVKELSQDETAGWVVVDTFARLPKFTNSINNMEWKHVWNGMKGAKFGHAIAPGFWIRARPGLDWVLENVLSEFEKDLAKWRKSMPDPR